MQKYKTNNSYELANHLKVHIIEWDFPNEIMGVYKYYKRNKFIYLNSNIREEKKLFVCGHEIGHSIVHPRVNTMFLKSKTLYSKDKLEREANLFSLSLLLHHCDFSEFNDINHICSHYGIPHELSYLVKNFC
ncbi:ImmA/IrrE family metallo-endopeptidase [Cytobacillus kochii]|uniref:ImmA/IrrE family metallo-endopeptidase n=1 Tax=Cytobacillus kochii TaxID=859143 RepID=UPI0027D7EEE2|nr:ImmA/IrrE family metallo-endopeptidase [Cytobacillus kochii]